MEVGTRVVRGPDWKWQNQDGGEGHVGSLVEIGKPGNNNTPEKTVVVQWDSGFRTNYRVGYQGAYDLRVFDNAPIGVKHPNIICDACKKQEVQGIRWKCTKCYDFDLCNLCYMNNKHDLTHSFARFETANCDGVKVDKRQGGLVLEAFGVFSGARVQRGPDWDWGNQDGGEHKVGHVLDVRGWDLESGRSVANVTWTAGATNVYRMGHKGKVDLKYKEPASGGTYYPQHLPVLGKQAEASPYVASQCQFKVGDKVRVDLEVDILRMMQEGHGGWNPRMAEYVGKTGTVHRITDRGDVRVQYEGCTNRWTFHAGALTKVKQFAVGDYVKISETMQDVKDRQKGHGEWTDNMLAALGKTGRVLKVYVDGDLRVQVGGQTWTFNPACCSLVPYGQQTDNNTLGGMSSHDREDTPTPLSAILEELLEVSPAPCTEPDKLVREAAQGHTDIVREIIAKHTDKVDVKSSGKTALQVSSHQGHVDIVRLLLAAGSNLELQDEDGDTALHYSAFGNQPDILELLLQKGANINALNSGLCSALHVAVNKQHSRCVKVLLRHKCDVNIQDSYGDTALHDAIGKNSRDIVELLTANPGTDFTLRNKRGFNVLHHAALKGNNHATHHILQKTRQIVDSKKDDGFAALHLASLNGHKDVAQTLIQMGKADAEIRNNRQQTPLLLAVSQGHTSLVELLVTKGASVRVEDEDGDTCLHLALMRQDVASSQPNAQTAISRVQRQIVSRSVQALQAESGVAMACYLIECGADLYKRNQQQKSPLDLVQEKTVADTLLKFAKVRQSSGDACNDPKEECHVCSEATADVRFEPCGHMVMCLECCKQGCFKMKKCLVCRKVIDKKMGPDGIDLHQLESAISSLNVEDLQQKVQEMECSICMERQRTVVFLCGHSSCGKCSESLKICHMCRKTITKKINLF